LHQAYQRPLILDALIEFVSGFAALSKQPLKFASCCHLPILFGKSFLVWSGDFRISLFKNFGSVIKFILSLRSLGLNLLLVLLNNWYWLANLNEGTSLLLLSLLM
jgi:hypothetical protein